MKLNPKAFGLTCGILWGAGLFSLTWWVMAFEGSSRKPTGLSKLYRGYTISPAGSIIGLVWGFCDAFFGGLSFAWLYNELVRYFAVAKAKRKEVAPPPPVLQTEAV